MPEATQVRREVFGAEVVGRARAKLAASCRGELEFAGDDEDFRLLVRRLERVRRHSGSFRAVSLSPYMESLLQLGH